MIIGKRNTNCLSCAEEPKSETMVGANGKVYYGTHIKRPDVVVRRGGSVDRKRQSVRSLDLNDDLKVEAPNGQFLNT